MNPKTNGTVPVKEVQGEYRQQLMAQIVEPECHQIMRGLVPIYGDGSSFSLHLLFLLLRRLLLLPVDFFEASRVASGA